MISNIVLPLIVLVVVAYGLFKKQNVYDHFVEGAKESFELSFTMFPCLLGMILSVNIFINSGFFSVITSFLTPIFNLIKFPIELLPMAIMRPISGSSSLAILNSIFGANGPDSFIGRVASVIQGSTDTTFYVLTLYFGSIGIKKIRHAMWVGLLTDLVGIITSLMVVSLLFG